MKYLLNENNRIILRPRDILAKRMLSPISRDYVIIRPGHIAITNYVLGKNSGFEKYISSRNNWKYKMVGGYYYKEVKELRLPRGYDVRKLKQFFPEDKYSYIYDSNSSYDKGLTIPERIYLTKAPNNDIQRIVLANILSLPPYEKYKKITCRAVDMFPGDGKTYVALAAGMHLRRIIAVFVHSETLIDQWRSRAKYYTSITDKDIYVIQGSDSILKLEKNDFKKKYPLYIISEDTIQSYRERRGNYSTERLFKELGIGTKIVDEIHKNMSIVSMIEALSNADMNISLSGTYMRADKIENYIINSMYKSSPRIGGDLKVKDELHLNVIVVRYKWFPSEAAIKSFLIHQNGYITLHSDLYEQALIKEAPGIVNKMIKIISIQFSKILKEDSRIHFMCSCIEGVEYFKEVLSELYPNRSIGVYHSKIPKKLKKKALESDIIISTTRGLGEGNDLPNLQITQNIKSYSNKKDAKQIPLRSRKLADREVFYVEYVNVGYGKTFNQFNNHISALESIAKKNKIHYIDI